VKDLNQGRSVYDISRQFDKVMLLNYDKVCSDEACVGSSVQMLGGRHGRYCRVAVIKYRDL
jgi:hypothetical protein